MIIETGFFASLEEAVLSHFWARQKSNLQYDTRVGSAFLSDDLLQLAGKRWSKTCAQRSN
jgi:hypothetical protein